MAITNQPTSLSVQDYVGSAFFGDIRHEYIGGKVYEKAAASKNHERIVTTLVRRFGNHLENKPYDIYISRMQVKINNDFFYPDLMVVNEDWTEHDYYTESPLMLIEVMSKLTRKNDKTLKRAAYQCLPSLKEYVLIEQDFVEVEVSRRDRHWQAEHYFLGDEVNFDAIDLRVAVESIYAHVSNDEMRELAIAKFDAQ